eukprot:Opistho-2@3997
MGKLRAPKSSYALSIDSPIQPTSEVSAASSLPRRSSKVQKSELRRPLAMRKSITCARTGCDVDGAEAVGQTHKHALILSDDMGHITTEELAVLQELATGDIVAVFGLYSPKNDSDDDVDEWTVSFLAAVTGMGSIDRVKHSRLIVTENEVIWHYCKPAVGRPPVTKTQTFPFEDIHSVNACGVRMVSSLHTIGFTTKAKCVDSATNRSERIKFMCCLPRRDVDFIANTIRYQKDVYDAWAS